MYCASESTFFQFEIVSSARATGQRVMTTLIPWGLRMVSCQCHQYAKKPSLAPVETITKSPFILVVVTVEVTLVGCIMSANATFGRVFAKIQGWEKLVIMQLNIAVEIMIGIVCMMDSTM